MSLDNSSQAIASIFRPTITLLRRYSRFVSHAELDALQSKVTGLQAALYAAHRQGDIYEASCVRGELRVLRRELEQTLEAQATQSGIQQP